MGSALFNSTTYSIPFICLTLLLGYFLLGCGGSNTVSLAYEPYAQPLTESSVFTGLALEVGKTEYNSKNNNPTYLFSNYYLDKPVSDFISEAVLSELQAVGARAQASQILIIPTVQSLVYDPKDTISSSENIQHFNQSNFQDTAPTEKTSNIAGFGDPTHSVTMQENTRDDTTLELKISFKIINQEKNAILFEGNFSKKIIVMDVPTKEFKKLLGLCILDFLNYPEVIKALETMTTMDKTEDQTTNNQTANT